MNPRILPDIDELKRLYFEERLTLQQIADRYGVTRGAVYLQFKYYNVQPRARGYDPVNKEYPNWSDQTTRQILLGSLLDGGRFAIQGTNKETIQYHESHGPEFDELITWKNVYLKFQSSTHENKTVLSSRWHPELDNLYAKYYKDGRKNIRAILDELDTLGLYVWYSSSASNINNEIWLTAIDFTDEEQFYAKEWFDDFHGLTCKPLSKRVQGRQQRNLVFPKEDADELQRIIAKVKFEIMNR